MSRLAKLFSARFLLDKTVRELGIARDLLVDGRTGIELDLTDRRDSADDDALIARIARAYAAAKKDQATVAPGPYQVGGAWKDDINRRRGDWLRALEGNDRTALRDLFKNFLRNSGSAGLSAYTYFEQISRAGRRCRALLKRSLLRDYRLWLAITVDAKPEDLRLPAAGNPWGVRIDGTLVTMGSVRYHYWASRMSPLLADLPEPVLCEVGGGYGGFAYFLLRDAETRLTYVDFDIPEVLLVASYYLLKAFPDRKALLYGEADAKSLTRQTLRGYDIVLLPNFAAPALAAGSIDVGFNTGSFSEMDYPSIEEYLRRLAGAGASWLFHVNSDREATNTGGHIEVPASRFPIPDGYRLLYRLPGGFEERYREFLYRARRV